MDNFNIELVNELINRKLHITTCESCTGGLIASRIIDVAGSSQILDEAYITYASSSKVSLVNVDKNVIEKYGVVSEQTAYEMALKSSIKAKSELSISSTGVAGPTGGTIDNPIGTVCFGFKVFDNIYTKKVIFENKGRNYIRNEAADYAIKYMLELIKKLKK